MRRPERESGRARFYHDVQLRGPIPSALLFHPQRAAAPSPALTEAALEWSRADELHPGTPAGLDALHRFDWLPALSVAGREGSRAVRRLAGYWLDNYQRFSPTAWRPALTAPRLVRMLCFAGLLAEGVDGPERQRLLDTMARQARHLSRFVRSSRDKAGVQIHVARTLASLCLPEDKLIGAPDTTRLGAVLRPIAEGHILPSWRLLDRAVEDANDLLTLEQAFTARRLSPPPELGEVLKVLRLYIGGFMDKGGAIAQMPGWYCPDLAALERIAPTRHPQADILIEQAGFAHLRAGPSLLVMDGGMGRALSGTGAISFLSDGQPIIVNCGAPSEAAIGIVPRMAAWADALSAPAATSSFDTPAQSAADIETTPTQSGPGLRMEALSTTGLLRRQIALSADGRTLFCEDHPANATANLRLHLAEGISATTDGARLHLQLPGERAATFTVDGASIGVEESVSAWTDGVLEKTSQIVLTPAAGTIRWRIDLP